MSPQDRTARVKQLAEEAGFPLCRVAPAGPIGRGDYLLEWLRSGRAGTMHYLHHNVNLRLDPRGLLDGARSVVVVALPYGQDPPEPPADDVPRGRTAMYAWGEDYHTVVKKKLFEVTDAIRSAFGGETLICVDTKPIAEREMAAAAGIGWIGKNTLVLNQELGSFFFLGCVLTTVELAPDEPMADHCGSCTRCLDACPTKAFPAPYQMDATRCISYLTIEHRGEIPPELHGGMGDWVFGCDICQDVCPFNRGAPPTHEPRFAARPALARPALPPMIDWTPDDYRRELSRSAMKRATLPMLQRNARIALGNVGREPEK